MLPYFRDNALLRLLHPRDHLVAGGAAREFVGLRQQRALARYFMHRAREDVVVGEPADDLFRGQAFGNRDRVLHHLAVDDGADDIAQAGILLELIFAGLEIGARLQREYGADERPAVIVDHAFALQGVGDVAHAGARRDVDDLVLLQRTGRLQLLLAVVIGAGGAEHCHQQDGDDGVADHDEWIAGALGPSRRRRNLLGLQRGARRPWRNGRPLTHRCNLKSCRFNRGLADCRFGRTSRPI